MKKLVLLFVLFFACEPEPIPPPQPIDRQAVTTLEMLCIEDTVAGEMKLVTIKTEQQTSILWAYWLITGNHNFGDWFDSSLYVQFYDMIIQYNSGKKDTLVSPQMSWRKYKEQNQNIRKGWDSIKAGATVENMWTAIEQSSVYDSVSQYTDDADGTVLFERAVWGKQEKDILPIFRIDNFRVTLLDSIYRRTGNPDVDTTIAEWIFPTIKQIIVNEGWHLLTLQQINDNVNIPQNWKDYFGRKLDDYEQGQFAGLTFNQKWQIAKDFTLADINSKYPDIWKKLWLKFPVVGNKIAAYIFRRALQP